MSRRRIAQAEVMVGHALPWNVYDGQGRLLMSRGHVITSETQIESLTERGLFAEAGAGAGDRDAGKAAEVQAPPSSVSLVFTARRELHHILAPNTTRDKFPERVQRIAAQLQQSCVQNQNAALATMLLAEDGPYSARHAVDVALVCHIMGSKCGLDDAGLMATVAAALTMNITMASLQDALQSRETVLSAEERQLIQLHPEDGVEALRRLGVTDEIWLAAVLNHHEAFDGSGYPAGKAGDHIPRGAQLVALADKYCARIAARDYRPALRPNTVLRKLFLKEESLAGKELSALLIKALGVFPPGTAVRLANGEIAVVVGQGDKADTPEVCSVIGPRGAPLSTPIPRNTGRPLHAVREVVDRSALGATASLHALFGKDALLN